MGHHNIRTGMADGLDFDGDGIHDTLDDDDDGDSFEDVTILIV